MAKCKTLCCWPPRQKIHDMIEILFLIYESVQLHMYLVSKLVGFRKNHVHPSFICPWTHIILQSGSGPVETDGSSYKAQ